MTNEILGSGLRFPISVNERGGLATSRHAQKVEESIQMILSTAKGERVMRPEFGCGIHDFAFAVANTANLTMMKSSVREALIVWEPRIEVLDVTTSTDRLEDGRIDITVNYRLRATMTEFNLVYPFYLSAGG